MLPLRLNITSDDPALAATDGGSFFRFRTPPDRPQLSAEHHPSGLSIVLNLPSGFQFRSPISMSPLPLQPRRLRGYRPCHQTTTCVGAIRRTGCAGPTNGGRSLTFPAELAGTYSLAPGSASPCRLRPSGVGPSALSDASVRHSACMAPPPAHTRRATPQRLPSPPVDFDSHFVLTWTSGGLCSDSRP